MPFVRVVKVCGLNPAEVTMYALRHSSIVRQLLAGVPRSLAAARCRDGGSFSRRTALLAGFKNE